MGIGNQKLGYVAYHHRAVKGSGVTDCGKELDESVVGDDWKNVSCLACLRSLRRQKRIVTKILASMEYPE